MRNLLRSKFLALALCTGMLINPIRAHAEDIDIFVGSSAGSHDNPNVLIILDNTSNWSRQSQKWPGGVTQGQSEVNAIKTLLPSLTADVNVGVMEFVTEGTANDDGGYIRHAISPMSSDNQATLSTKLTTIYNDINGVHEKRNSGTPYGNLMYDAYNYFAGVNSLNPTATYATYADSAGYTTSYTKFKAPLSKDNSCARNYIIFISNPNASGPTADSSANKTALAALGGDTGQLSLPAFTTSNATSSTAVGNSTSCYSSAAVCTAAGAAAYAGASFAADCADTTKYDASPACSCSTAFAGTAACSAGTQRYTVQGTVAAGTTLSTGTSVDCYASVTTPGTIAPTNFPTTKGNNAETFSCPSGSTMNFTAKTKITANGSCKDNYIYSLACKKTDATTTDLGYTSSCYTSTATCSTADYAACSNGTYASCACITPPVPVTSGSSCAAGTSLYTVQGNSLVTTLTATGVSTVDTATYNIDEWARFLFQKGVPVADTTTRQKISTYTIDVFNAQQNATHSSLMMSTAKAGGGKYFTATNEDALLNSLKQIFAEITSVNSTFASASLPVNATNRAQNENQVFIGMFRPDPDAKPRWFGNLKRYQLILGADGQTVLLGDKDGKEAINSNTGFVTDCASSFWTSDSSNYWQNYPVNPDPSTTCTTSTNNAYSDAPDGPRVEKGAVAEVLRKGNNPPDTNTTPTWTVNRNVLATNSNTSTALSALSGLSILAETTRNWVLGQDTADEDGDGNLTETRASIHGDVVHSRPLPINYGSGNIVVYYGANDGNFRAVDASTGKEKWSFFPYEFTTRRANASTSSIERLNTNSPLVSYPSVDMSITPTPVKKDYFWDGSVGVFQNADNSKVWIYPTMRRGGRNLYALDVTNSASPAIKWRAGCPNLTDDGDCTDGMSGIGQTWALPNIAPIKGYSTTSFVALLGGGYDTCEDGNAKAPSCSSPKGAAVYIIDADSGTLIKTLTTARSVVADVTVVDVDNDGFADYAYVLDTGGNVYRIDFVTRTVAGDGTVSYTTRASADWTIARVAHTNGLGEGRKFLFAPALLTTSAKTGKIYVAMGSGDREHPLLTHYPYTEPVKNRFYVYLDDLSTAATDTDLDGATMSNNSVDPGCDAGKILSTSALKGWYMDLTLYASKGEQTVTSPLITGGLVTFSTNRPLQPAEQTCTTPLGEARGYWLNLLNGSGAINCPDGTTNCTCGGTRSSVFVGGGLPPSPVMGTVPVNGTPTTVVIGAPQRSGSVSTPISPQKTVPSINSSRKRVYSYSKGSN